jgi:hypothetical protein
LARARKSSGKRKAEGTKAEAYVPRRQSAAELAASRGISEAALLAEFRASLEVHGERAEDKLPKEFSPWLVKFAQAVDGNKARKDAWQELKSKCDVVFVLQHLYLFTYPGKTTSDVLQDACRFLKDELDKLLPKFSAVSEATSALFADPKLRLLSVLSEAVPQVFAQPIRSIAMAEEAIEATRRWAETMGSYKTEAHDLHLYAMATSVRAATGKYHFPELATLIEAARASSGAEDETFDEGNMKRRVHRYAKRMNLAGSRP